MCVAGAAVGCCPEGDARCAFDSCGVVGEVVEACPYGCAAGECEACVADCGERVCGDDGCGGACGSCPEGKACGSDGQCSCTADVGLGCCGDAVCRVDSCGGMGAVVEACPYGCGAAACLPCVPACEGRACGADGCGGTCGEAPCAAGAVCVDGQCVCEDLGAVACCAGDGAALCALDSCGAEIATLEACAYGCDEGACLPCPPACEGRACGPDGCGGICGACSGGAQCDEEAGACVCVPAGATCCGEARCALDSCGEVGDEIEPCSWGCAQGACLPCPPTCGGKACGPDGCGGSCGACGPGLSCSVAGQCLACLPACDGKSCGPDGCGGTCGSCAAPSECRLETGTCSPVVSGRLLRERIAPNASLTALGSVAVVPAAAVPFSVSAGGAVLATGVTAADGTYTALLATAPVGPVTVTFAAVALDAAGAPVLGVADASGVSFPSAPYQPIVSPRVWAWTATGTAQQLALGDLTVTVAQGSGALQLFAWGRELRAFLTALYGVPTVPALGFLWSPSVTPMCLSCFFPTGWGPLRVPVVGGGSVDFTRFIWFSGTGGSSGSPHHWTPSMVGHEYGHYVMDVFSRSPNEGGAHSWDGLLNPGLAWSEGFATFYGQRWLSGDGEQPRFFAVQGGTQYWVDLDRIGTSPTSDDSVFGIVFPLPRATGGLSQTMNEAVIAAILWDLWDLGPLTGETEVAGLDDAVFDLLASPRMLNASYERGYGKADLVDFLDAVRCADALAPAALTGVLMGFPYDNSPSCPP